MKTKKIKNKNSGFIALLTVVIASIILTMVMGISSIAVKELVLTAGAKEGSRALFAADAGIECGLYWDVHQKTPAPNNTSYFDISNNNNNSLPISCAGDNAITPVWTTGLRYGFNYDVATFYLNLSQGCAEVKVYKKYPIDAYPAPLGDGSINTSGSNSELFTMVESRGYNVSCVQAISIPSPSTLVERGIRTYY